MSLAQRIHDQLTARFMKGMLATPRGRAHVLNQVADAEATDEGAIFDRLLLHVTDPKLRQMIERHQADELRHARMFLGCLERTGIAPHAVPRELKLLDRIDSLAGHIMDQPVRSDEDVMNAYLMLLVIEERAIRQFTGFIAAFEAVDRQTADVFRAIADDEERHLLYCHAISKRYAPDEAAWERELERFRALEERAFSDNTVANMDYTFAHGLHAAGPVEQLLWRSVTSLSARARRLAPRPASFGLAAAAR